jgi:hypothetical protein
LNTYLSVLIDKALYLRLSLQALKGIRLKNILHFLS